MGRTDSQNQWHRAGIEHLKAGRFREAVEAFEKAVEIEATHHIPFYLTFVKQMYYNIIDDAN